MNGAKIFSIAQRQGKAYYCLASLYFNSLSIITCETQFVYCALLKCFPWIFLQHSLCKWIRLDTCRTRNLESIMTSECIITRNSYSHSQAAAARSQEAFTASDHLLQQQTMLGKCGCKHFERKWNWRYRNYSLSPCLGLAKSWKILETLFCRCTAYFLRLVVVSTFIRGKKAKKTSGNSVFPCK